MSKFYGRVEGQASTDATRRGTQQIKASVQSWNGSVINTLYYNDCNELCINVEYSDYSEFYGYTIFNGTIKDYIKKLKNNY